MPQLILDHLLEYTDWERAKWREWFGKNGDQALKISPGTGGDGRFESAGDLVRHIFSSEKRYVERLSGRPLTDTRTIPSDSAQALFQFGAQSRKELREFVKTFPADKWDIEQEFNLMNSILKVTPRKIVLHVIVHEIRHWAQIGTLLRLNGLTVEMHDFLFSPVLGGGVST